MEIFVPKHREILVPIPPLRARVGGEFRIQLLDCMGGLDYDSGWFGNLIMNQGLGFMTTLSAWYTYFYIGSGSTAPSTLDTQMETLLAASSTNQGVEVDSTPAAPNWECTSMLTKRFAAGVGTGTIREVGVGGNAGSTQLVARQAVSPSITKLASQVLDLSYRFKWWPPIVDLADTIIIDGATYNIITRGLQYNSAKTLMIQYGPKGVFSGWQGAHNGNLEALNASGSGGQSCESVTWQSGGNNAVIGYREFDAKWGLNQGNIANGIRTAWHQLTTGHKIQTQFNRASDNEEVLKDGTYEWTPRWRIEWARS